MANLTITNTFSNGTTADASQVNTNFSDVKTWLNNRDNASDFWLNLKINASAANPVEFKSSAVDCEVDIDCTGANGTPRISWRRSGTTYFSAGVDGAASNLFKLGTTGITTNVALQIPSTGAQVQFALGSISVPSVSFIGDTSTGVYRSSAGAMGFTCAGTEHFRVTTGGAGSEIEMAVYDVSASALKQVSRGAADSGGAGFRLLRVAN